MEISTSLMMYPDLIAIVFQDRSVPVKRSESAQQLILKVMICNAMDPKMI